MLRRLRGAPDRRSVSAARCSLSTAQTKHKFISLIRERQRWPFTLSAINHSNTCSLSLSLSLPPPLFCSPLYTNTPVTQKAGNVRASPESLLMLPLYFKQVVELQMEWILYSTAAHTPLWRKMDMYAGERARRKDGASPTVTVLRSDQISTKHTLCNIRKHLWSTVKVVWRFKSVLLSFTIRRTMLV